MRPSLTAMGISWSAKEEEPETENQQEPKWSQDLRDKTKDADVKTRIYLEYVIGLTTDEANEIADKIKEFYLYGREI